MRSIEFGAQVFELDLDRLASPWHTDAILGRSIEVVADMARSSRLRFPDQRPNSDRFLDPFGLFRAERVIP